MEEPESINNPHDRFVRRLLSDTDHVRELVSWQLPEAVVEVLDVDSIKPVKESYIDSTLREGVSDLVFEIKLVGGHDAYVVMVFEHKSTPDELTVFQVLRYMVQLNDQRLRQGEPLACVIPMVLYHGRRPWNAATRMNELLDVPDSLRCYVPDFTMAMLDLSRIPDEELRRESLFMAYMSLLKYIQRDELPEQLPAILEMIHKLLQPSTALQNMETVIRYLASSTERINRTDLEHAVKRIINTEGESLMPTIAQQWKQEGIEQGLEQGLEQGREQGIEQGKLIGRIQTLEESLLQSVSTDEALQRLPLEALRTRAEQLAAALRNP